MSLEWLYANHFRNITNTELELSPGTNLLFGENGSGKTSLLECCYFLSSARSFRSATIDPLIQRGSDDCLVRGKIRHQNQLHQVGISREATGTREIRLNGEKIYKSSDLARLLPTVTLGPESVDLLLGPPGNRRKFLNWGLFHVEPGFAALWEEANRCLKQRNGLLRDGVSDSQELDSWSVQLAALAERLDLARTNYLKEYLPVFEKAVMELSGLEEVRFDYFRGWDGQSSLLEIYQKDREIDQKRGFTQKGFQRADVRITVAGQPAIKVCSRGELKALVWAMILAQGSQAGGRTQQGTLYLIDDLASEFDAEHRQRVCRYLADTKSQLLLTGVDQEALMAACEGNCERLFYVKHGAVQES